MKNERRRDRVWRSVLNQFRRSGEVLLSNIDVTLETRVESQPEAEKLAAESEVDADDVLREDPGGEGFIVKVAPDASVGTKRYVLQTMAKERFRLAEKTDSAEGKWTIGPHLEYLFGQRDDTPIDDPFRTQFESSWESLDEFEMYSERRRDRLWFQTLNYAGKDQPVYTDDLDASLSIVTDRKSTAYRIIEQEEYRQESDISEEDGKFIVQAEPDVARSTKLSLLRTLEKERYGILTDNGHRGGWIPGPWARAIFSLEIDADDLSESKARELTEDLISDPTVEVNEAVNSIDRLTNL